MICKIRPSDFPSFLLFLYLVTSLQFAASLPLPNNQTALHRRAPSNVNRGRRTSPPPTSGLRALLPAPGENLVRQQDPQKYDAITNQLTKELAEGPAELERIKRLDRA